MTGYTHSFFPIVIIGSKCFEILQQRQPLSRGYYIHISCLLNIQIFLKIPRALFLFALPFCLLLPEEPDDFSPPEEVCFDIRIFLFSFLSFFPPALSEPHPNSYLVHFFLKQLDPVESTNKSCSVFGNYIFIDWEIAYILDNLALHLEKSLNVKN